MREMSKEERLEKKQPSQVVVFDRDPDHDVFLLF